MSELYISRWWRNEGPLSGTDDSLLLLDYLGGRAADSGTHRAPFTLKFSDVLADLHLLSALDESHDAWFGVMGVDERHFDIDDMVLLDLSGILLECAERGAVNLMDLDPDTRYAATVRFDVDVPSDVELVIDALQRFAAHPEQSVLSQVLDADELREHSAAAFAMASELLAHFPQAP
jgi:hypothetical protein